ncbi:HEXXH motif-containing protein, partial [Streptomyces sp. LBL]|uniref:hypothetical protein n=1 Tax=Streptomyces sp. LBL TaxID=2940562 RepID=UPI002476937D
MGEEIHDGYADLVGRNLGRFLMEVGAEDPELESEVLVELSRLKDDSLGRVLLAPETTRFLMWPDVSRDVTAPARRLIKSVRAELARDGETAEAISDPVWTALGDALILPGGRVVHAPSVKGIAALDLDSPYALSVDVQGVDFAVTECHVSLSGTEREDALAKLSAATECISLVNSEILRFVEKFTKTLILVRDDSESIFSSGSCAQYVGRSVLGNPQLSFVDEVTIAEGVVHESIHGLLYMHETMESWVLDESLFGGGPTVSSPWTGRTLPIRPFLQACFVWYGLFRFWSIASETGHFVSKRVMQRREAAARGFAKESLVGLVQPYTGDLNHHLIEAIDDLQGRVQKSL